MTEFGIWSESVGGFLEVGCFRPEDGEDAARAWVSERGSDPADLSVVAVCAFHEGERRDDCPSCFAEDVYGEPDYEDVDL